MKRLLLLFLLLLVPSLSWAQLPGGNTIQIDRTPVTGGTALQCLYISSTNKVGSQACGTITSISASTINASTWLRVGSASPPTNTTAGDLTVSRIAIGDSSLTGYRVLLDSSITGAATAYGVASFPVVQSDVTTHAQLFSTFVQTQAASFSLGAITHYRAAQGTIGAGSSVTNQFGFSVAQTLTGATNNFAFYSDLAAASGRWNLYMNGTAQNYLAGPLLLGSSALTVSAGSLGLSKITASASAPGASGGKLELVCGTNAGTAKLIVYAGTSGTAVTVTDNIGAGVTGC